MAAHRFSTIVAVTATLVAAPAAAQDTGFQLGVYGGAATPLANLDQAGSPDGAGGVAFRHFSAGLDVGVAATLWLEPNLGLRLDATYVTSKATEPLSATTWGTTSWKKMFVGGDIMLRGLTAAGVSPYAYFGLGLGRLDESGSAYPVANRAVGRFGTGLGYTPSSGGIGFFAEAGLLVYDFRQELFPFYDKVQTDVAWKAGVSFSR